MLTHILRAVSRRVCMGVGKGKIAIVNTNIRRMPRVQYSRSYRSIRDRSDPYVLTSVLTRERQTSINQVRSISTRHYLAFRR